ncbi:MAG: antitoxin Xre/MbcA/ParS toxin-binding domain-containing protein [Bacteroidota bacterium]
MKPNRRKELKNVKSYRPSKKASTRPLIFPDLHEKYEDEMEDLLQYDGTEEIEIPGTFLKEIPASTNLPVNHLVKMLDMSKTTFYRVKQEVMLDMDTVDKLSAVFKIYDRGAEAFEGEEAFDDWMNTKIATLGNRRPIDMLSKENGRVAVLEAIDRVEYGVYG